MSDAYESYEAEVDGFPTSADDGGLRARLPLEVLASQFVDQLRAGTDPSIDDYCSRFPKLADQIREVFPMLAAMERWKGEKESDSLKRQFPDEFNIERLGNCRIEREVARGGMGVVFEARQGDRRVAVKLLPWRVAGIPGWRERFEREARTVQKLRHRNIVPVYSFGEHDGYCYYVMQFVDGVSLDRIIHRLRQTDGIVYTDEIRQHAQNQPPGRSTFAVRLSDEPHADATSAVTEHEPEPAANPQIMRDSWKMFARIGLQASHALQHAHALGTLHNDVKPGNLLLDADGRLWMTDFGLARSVEPDSKRRDDRLTGTLRYMAPERFQGVSDERSDIYSLGVTLYELLTLSPAFQADDSQSMVRLITESRPDPPRTRNPRIPRALEEIVLKATAPDPQARYQATSDCASDLSRFLESDLGQARTKLGFRKLMRSWHRFRRSE